MTRRAMYLSADEGCLGNPGHAVFEVTETCTVRGLLMSLGLSKTAVARMLSCGQVVAVEPDGSPSRHTPLPAQLEMPPGARFAVVMRASDAIVSGTARRSRPASRPDGGPSVPHVLYEDPFSIAVDKPAGLLVHGDGTDAPTLAALVQAYFDERGSAAWLQAVQRLDVETTGVILFSKTLEFQSLFDDLVASKDMEKRYLVVVRGAFPQACCTYTDPIARDRHDARRMRVAQRGGRDALTRVERLAVAPDGAYSLLAVRLGTGRRHQIRVHLAAHGHPVVNDSFYGMVENGRGMMLHAWVERFIHPVTGVPVCIDAGWPVRFASLFSPDELAACVADSADMDGRCPVGTHDGD